ncbi:MAG TPA: GDP-mannose 4,6-dehydratase [Ignavibacteria bacterium]|nr:GDP-mannose 4,6-dehydratase [Ignavibacteria bacterium]HMQ99165.1 GDP-mannose 4,6-dehydratase [Ignavibacteria bacterium]
MKNNFRSKKVLVTGGLGFVGSNLSIKLAELGADVLIVDNMLPRQGGNLFNIEPVKDKVKVNISDIRNSTSMNHLVKGMDYIYHIAGQVNHVDSVKDPLNDLSINVEGTLVLMEALRMNNPDAKVIFTGTRGEYGSSLTLPVAENHAINPIGIYAITNFAAERIVLTYHNLHNIKSLCLRITNTFGPRHQMAHDEYGVFNWFIRKAIDNEVIPIFGDGRILRDYLYIDDLTASLIKIADCGTAYGEVYNVGSGVPLSFIELAKMIIDIAGTGSVDHTEFTTERKALEPGDYYADITRIKKTIDWAPEVTLDDGIRKTIEFYKKYKKHYW